MVTELPQYYVENSREPIIDSAVFNQAQAEMRHRAEKLHKRSKKAAIYTFTSVIRCGLCGKYYTHGLQGVILEVALYGIHLCNRVGNGGAHYNTLFIKKSGRYRVTYSKITAYVVVPIYSLSLDKNRER